MDEILAIAPMEDAREITFSWRRICLYWVLFVVIIGTFPWFGGRPHWERVTWIPFVDVLDSWRRLLDGVANFLLYLPFGFSYVQVRSSSRMRAMIEALLLALLLAAGCEFYQVFSPVRYPTMTDIVTNTAGAFLGAAIGRRLHGRKLVLVFGR